MKIGFTGTRNGMLSMQRKKFDIDLDMVQEHSLDPFANEFHHGDCVGADADGHDVADEHNFHIVIHPPVKNDLRAWKDGDEVREPNTYFARNRNIVNETDILYACPPTDEELKKGGTWYTINYARKVGKPVRIFWPYGRATHE